MLQERPAIFIGTPGVPHLWNRGDPVFTEFLLAVRAAVRRDLATALPIMLRIHCRVFRGRMRAGITTNALRVLTRMDRVTAARAGLIELQIELVYYAQWVTRYEQVVDGVDWIGGQPGLPRVTERGVPTVFGYLLPQHLADRIPHIARDNYDKLNRGGLGGALSVGS